MDAPQIGGRLSHRPIVAARHRCVKPVGLDDRWGRREFLARPIRICRERAEARVRPADGTAVRIRPGAASLPVGRRRRMRRPRRCGDAAGEVAGCGY